MSPSTHGNLAFTAGNRSVPVGHRSALSAARSRCLVWHKLPPTGRSDGHRRGHNCAALTLAECLRRAVIGSIRRECLDHLVIFNQRHLRRVFTSYLEYYHRTRTHLSLDKDCPEQRPIQVPKVGKIIAIPQVGGMHHRYQRLAA